MALHSRKDRDDMPMWYRGALFMVDPPIDKCFVGNYVETLLWRRGLGERIGNIGTKNKKVLHRRNKVEDPTPSLINTVGICLIENLGLAECRDLSQVHRALYLLSKALIAYAHTM